MQMFFLTKKSVFVSLDFLYIIMALLSGSTFAIKYSYIHADVCQHKDKIKIWKY